MEKLRRARAVGKRNDIGGQLPLVKMGGSFSEFYDSVRKETSNGTKLPNWRGELYGEFHRYVHSYRLSESLTKKGNIHYSSQGQEGESKERDLDERGGICSYHG